MSRRVEGGYLACIQAMNRSGGVKLAVDVPSGVSTTTGEVATSAFKADLTVTFQCAKLGCDLWIPAGITPGRWSCADIGVDVPRAWRETARWPTPWRRRTRGSMLPRRRPDSHKGDYGKALIIAGSRGMAGAAYLAALAAYRTGAGLVQIYTPEDNRTILQTLLPEAIIRCYDFFDERELLRLLELGGRGQHRVRPRHQ